MLSVVGQHRLGQRPYAFVALPCTMYCMVADEGPASLAQMRRGAIEYCVLALVKDEERYGFELVRELAAADGLVTSEGTVYPLLTRLSIPSGGSRTRGLRAVTTASPRTGDGPLRASSGNGSGSGTPWTA